MSRKGASPVQEPMVTVSALLPESFLDLAQRIAAFQGRTPEEVIGHWARLHVVNPDAYHAQLDRLEAERDSIAGEQP